MQAEEEILLAHSKVDGAADLLSGLCWLSWPDEPGKGMPLDVCLMAPGTLKDMQDFPRIYDTELLRVHDSWKWQLEKKQGALIVLSHWRWHSSNRSLSLKSQPTTVEC